MIVDGPAGMRVQEFDIYIRSFQSDRAGTAVAGLARAFGLDQRRARELVQSLPRVVKRRVSAEQVARYAQVLRELGADLELRPSPIRPQQVIAVQGASGSEERQVAHIAAQSHGSTLTLTLPPPQPVAPAAPQALAARVAQFATTVVEPGPPPALAAELQSRPSSALDSDAVPDAMAVLVPDPAPPGESSAAGWLTSASLASLHALAAKQAPRTPGDLPPPWEVPGLDRVHLDGRPAWLVDGPRACERSAVVAPAGAAPAILAGAPSSVPAPHSRAPHAPASAAPGALELDDPAIATRARAPSGPALGARHVAVGHAVGREAFAEPPMALRLALRVGLGLSLFMIVTALRSALDSDVNEARAAWNDSPGSERTSETVFAPPRRPSSGVKHGPRALEWMSSNLHQFTNPDKDAVRSRVNAYLAAGAVDVYVGNIVRSGPVQIAGELIVELPGDPTQRKAVLAEHQRVISATFGGFAARLEDPGGAVLRVTL